MTSQTEGIAFSWHDSPEAVVVPSQEAVAVYTNPTGGIVIRQCGWPDDDQLVIVAPRYIPTLVKALEEAAEEAANTLQAGRAA